MLLFVGLELISIPTYVLLYLGRHDAQCQESTVKYFFLSVLSSGDSAVRLQFSVRSGRLDRVWPPCGPRWRRRGPADGLRRAVEVGDGADLRGPVLQDRRRAVPFLRARRVPGDHLPECGAAVGGAQGGGAGW